MTEREIFEKFDKLSENKLNTKSNKNVFVKNTIMAKYYHVEVKKKRYKDNRRI